MRVRAEATEARRSAARASAKRKMRLSPRGIASTHREAILRKL